MIKITYAARQTMPLDQVVDFQGDAKTITQESLDRLKRSIKKHGFFVPLFVWSAGAKSPMFIIDGHQRRKALMQLAEEGEEIPEIPIEYIEAKSRKDAAEKLLAVSSQFGEFNPDNLAIWAEGLRINLPTLDIRLVNHEIDLSALDIDIDQFFEEAGRDPKGSAQKTITCPHCGQEFVTT